jgi:hypothetical protein
MQLGNELINQLHGLWDPEFPVPGSKGLSNNPYPEPNQSSSLYPHLDLF